MNYLRGKTLELTIPHRWYRNGDIQAEAKLCQSLPLFAGHVETALQWTRDDVLANGGSFIEDNTVEKPPEIQDLEIKLCEKRSFNVSRFHLG